MPELMRTHCKIKNENILALAVHKVIFILLSNLCYIIQHFLGVSVQSFTTIIFKAFSKSLPSWSLVITPEWTLFFLFYMNIFDYSSIKM